MSKLERINGANYECFFLSWDTDYFGVNSARVNLTGPIDDEGQDRIIDFCKGYEFVTIANMDNAKENNHWIGTRTNSFLVDMNMPEHILMLSGMNFDQAKYNQLLKGI